MKAEQLLISDAIARWVQMLATLNFEALLCIHVTFMKSPSCLDGPSAMLRQLARRTLSTNAALRYTKSFSKTISTCTAITHSVQRNLIASRENPLELLLFDVGNARVASAVVRSSRTGECQIQRSGKLRDYLPVLGIVRDGTKISIPDGGHRGKTAWRQCWCGCCARSCCNGMERES